jgi:hypothetical protein
MLGSFAAAARLASASAALRSSSRFLRRLNRLQPRLPVAQFLRQFVAAEVGAEGLVVDVVLRLGRLRQLADLTA